MDGYDEREKIALSRKSLNKRLCSARDLNFISPLQLIYFKYLFGASKLLFVVLVTTCFMMLSSLSFYKR